MANDLHAWPNEAVIDQAISDHRSLVLPRLQRMWDYYRNPMTPLGRAEKPAQALGLPARLTQSSPENPREIVVENDIAWRVHALVDFMFGKALVIQSTADQPQLRQRINDYLTRTFEGNGGDGFFHDLALLGAVYGHIDILLRLPDGPGRVPRLELIEPTRGVPLLNPSDYRRLDGYLISHDQPTGPATATPFFKRLLRRTASLPAAQRRTEAWSPERYRVQIETPGPLGGSRQTVAAGVNRLGRLPVVHIQNLPQPFAYTGLSDVEPLIPLQDELNTRLSDRANRVTFQSFKMYLGKGIENFTDRPVGPGQMWSTDNLDASIQAFGGDASTPSEDAHIREVREALDKTSGVSPIAAGLVGGKVGNLSSENAIRIVLIGLLARIEKKRLAYGHGLEQLCELILHAADVTGQLPNRPEDRRVRLDWPTPFPDSEYEQLRNAQLKQQLGVPGDQLLAELGYADCPAMS